VLDKHRFWFFELLPSKNWLSGSVLAGTLGQHKFSSNQGWVTEM
jgi:hypothetical protein